MTHYQHLLVMGNLALASHDKVRIGLALLALANLKGEYPEARGELNKLERKLMKAFEENKS